MDRPPRAYSAVILSLSVQTQLSQVPYLQQEQPLTPEHKKLPERLRICIISFSLELDFIITQLLD